MTQGETFSHVHFYAEDMKYKLRQSRYVFLANDLYIYSKCVS